MAFRLDLLIGSCGVAVGKRTGKVAGADVGTIIDNGGLTVSVMGEGIGAGEQPVMKTATRITSVFKNRCFDMLRSLSKVRISFPPS